MRTQLTKIYGKLRFCCVWSASLIWVKGWKDRDKDLWMWIKWRICGFSCQFVQRSQISTIFAFEWLPRFFFYFSNSTFQLFVSHVRHIFSCTKITSLCHGENTHKWQFFNQKKYEKKIWKTIFLYSGKA